MYLVGYSYPGTEPNFPKRRKNHAGFLLVSHGAENQILWKKEGERWLIPKSFA